MLDEQLMLLLLQVAVAAAVASILARLNAFVRMLMREERSFEQRLLMALAFGAVFGGGVAVRVVTGTYKAADLAVAGSFLAGVLGGYVAGLISGILISLPAMLASEFLTMPFVAGVGVLGGLIRDLSPDPEEIWRFSPVFNTLAHTRDLFRGNVPPNLWFQLVFIASILFSELLRYGASLIFPERIFAPLPAAAQDTAWRLIAPYAATLLCTVVPLRIWNGARTERKLEAQKLLINEARLQALQSQINPHFLFNTLNSISSLVRTNPEQARAVIYKLSSILRRLLRKHENVAPLRDELSFIEDYLSIEMVRFGEKLRFVRDVEAGAMNCLVPGMLLQPLVENSIKHGLASKLGGGTIRVTGRLESGRLRITVEDDGVGIPDERMERLFDHGIGVNNVNERLKVLYGDTYRMEIDSRPGEGTRIEIELPEGPSATIRKPA